MSQQGPRTDMTPHSPASTTTDTVTAPLLLFLAATRKTKQPHKSESYCLQLQQCGLTASIAPDSKFDGGGDGDGEGGGEG